MKIKLKRVYEEEDKSDGIRVLVDRLWPRGIKKEALHYDIWAKNITPSPDLRKWFHEDQEEHWIKFSAMYQKELETSSDVKEFIQSVKKYPVITLLYASKDKVHNHAILLKEFLEYKLNK